MNPIKIVITDTETTGLDRQKDEPIEIAGLRYEYPSWEPCGVFYKLVHPTMRRVDPTAAEVNGYTPMAWMGAERMTAELIDELIEFTVGCHWVGSMPQFDFDILDAQRRRLYPSRPWSLASHRLIDVGSLGAPLMFGGHTEKGGLDAICKVLGIPSDVPLLNGRPVGYGHPIFDVAGGRVGPHTAMGDTIRTVAVFRALMTRYVWAWTPAALVVAP